MLSGPRFRLKSDQETIGRETVQFRLDERIFLFKFFQKAVVVLDIQGRIKNHPPFLLCAFDQLCGDAILGQSEFARQPGDRN
jgi:hypothetical protein